MNLPHISTVYLDKESDKKLRTISAEMQLNKDSLVNFWLSRGLECQIEVQDTVRQDHHNSFYIMDDIRLEMQRRCLKHKIKPYSITYGYLKEPIAQAYEFLKSPLHTEVFKNIIHHYEQTVILCHSPNFGFKNLRNIKPSTPSTKNKIYIVIESYDGHDNIDSVYTSLELAKERMEDLQSGKDTNNAHSIHSYEENGYFYNILMS